MELDQDQLMAARDEHDDWLMQQPGVEGSSIGYDRKGRLSIRILTHAGDAALRERIRERLGELPVTFEETGPIAAQSGALDASTFDPSGEEE